MWATLAALVIGGTLLWVFIIKPNRESVAQKARADKAEEENEIVVAIRRSERSAAVRGRVRRQKWLDKVRQHKAERGMRGAGRGVRGPGSEGDPNS